MTARLLAVVGARPNFVKVAPVVHALSVHAVEVELLHTGQHYDYALSDAFIDQLALAPPKFHLRVGSGTHAEQTGAVMVGVERVLERERFDAVLVAGDVNSTMAAALAAVKHGVPVIHLEAGLRSGDWTMPEEVNRVVTDRVSDLLLCHCDEAVANLVAEGIDGERAALVGNTMIDSLFALRAAAEATGAVQRLGLASGNYVLVTLHRPALVDHPGRLSALMETLSALASTVPVVFPLHPRTRARLDDTLSPRSGALRLLGPLGYLEFACLEAHARLVVTDSGGVQEETSVLGVPCLTYRTTTERPVTIRLGTNRLVGLNADLLLQAATEALEAPTPGPAQIPLWDGQAGPRAADAIAGFVGQSTTRRYPRSVAPNA
jgi:UDP-N-acetylglucosamine 2-epimerase (non-hydrolysing)